jgi:glycosyltransferase involved in cell wall biosynthesis
MSPEFPDPAGNGGEVRLYHEISGLAANGIDVTVVAPGGRDAVARGVNSLSPQGVKFLPVIRPASRAREAAEALMTDRRVAAGLARRSWLGWQAAVYRSEMKSTFAEARSRDWDGLIIEHDWAAEWRHELPARIPAALVFQNLTDDLLRRQAASSNGVSKLRALRDATLSRRETMRAVAGFDRAFACSRVDADIVTSRYGLPCAVVPNGADTAALAEVDGSKAHPDRVLFTGTMNYPPNADGVAWFVDAVLPLVRDLRPGVLFEVVGRNPGEDILKLHDPGRIEIRGRVPDLRLHFEQAGVVVVPLRSGSGTKLKLLEALAAGRPVVATSIGAEGVEVRDGEHLLVADDTSAFARAVDRLLGDPAAANAMGEAGRRVATDRYSWSSIGAHFAAEVTSWLSGHSTSDDRKRSAP